MKAFCELNRPKTVQMHMNHTLGSYRCRSANRPSDPQPPKMYMAPPAAVAV